MMVKFGKVILGIISCFIFKPENNPITITMTVKIQIANLLFKEKLIIFFKRHTPCFYIYPIYYSVSLYNPFLSKFISNVYFLIASSGGSFLAKFCIKLCVVPAAIILIT